MAAGNSYSELNSPKLAEKIFRRAILSEPDNMALWFDLANVLFDQEKNLLWRLLSMVKLPKRDVDWHQESIT